MTTTFTLLRQRCGLSQREAAAFHSVSEQSVKAWDTARRQAPPGVIAQLRDLYNRIEVAAEEAHQAVEKNAPSDAVIEVGVASDDHEAQLLGLPCVGAHQALLGLVAAWTNRPVRVVARGSTVASAAAIEAHEK